ncbi:hypothetical protein [Lacinutrix chionoecetis]
MKKLFIIVFTVFLNGAFFSCTPTSIHDPVNAEQATGGEDAEILPEEPEDDGDN